MNRRNSFYIKAVFASLTLMLGSLALVSGVPADVSGEINQTRSRVTAYGADYVMVDEVSGFSPEDTVLVIQMKGDAILALNDGSFGSHQTYVGDAGFYEFVIIQAVDPGPGPGKITLRNNLKGIYPPETFVQIVKVESYETMRVTGTITCPAWDYATGTGGVIAIFASDKIILEANIDVSGKGFSGATSDVIIGDCITDLDSDPLYFYNSAFNRSGFKGEGYASHDDSFTPLDLDIYARGLGAIGTGGGGGDGSKSGGGGGGSYGAGGNGGDQAGCSSTKVTGGKGGYMINSHYADAVLMGGGGGASGYVSGSFSDGGSGGGIVLIMTDSIIGNGNSINANGTPVTIAAPLTSGGSGGGGGGAIVISANGYSSALALNAKGGKGGDANSFDGSGVGGGGGGGLVWLSTPVDAALTVSKAGGAGGMAVPYGMVPTSNGTDGPATRTDLEMRLNGFLFNTVVTAADGNLKDSICFGEVPRPLKASVPVGGQAPFFIYWEKSYTGPTPADTWEAITGTEIASIFAPDLAETVTLWIRRRIVDSSPTAIIDISKPVKIIVHPLITNFEIAHDTGDTICFNQDPTVIEPLVAVPGGGNSIYSYEWHASSDNISYSSTVLAGTSTYDPPAMTSTAWYRRTVWSGACVDSTSSLKIEVLPVISDNIVGDGQVICQDFLFTNLDNAGAAVSGGDGIFRWEWQASLDNSDWGHTIEGVTDTETYDPDEGSSDFPALTPKYFRRVVYSGEADCCVDISPAVSLTMQPRITNNGLSLLSQTVCEGVPEVSDITGTLPVGGTGTYTYQWQFMTTPPGVWTNLTDSVRKNLSIKSLLETTSFRRIAYSGVCENISTDQFNVTVEPVIAGNIISTLSGLTDTTICLGQDPERLIGPEPGGGNGIYSYQWQDSTADHSWQPAPLINSNIDYDPPVPDKTVKYRRMVLSGACESYSPTVEIVVLPLIAGNNVGSDQLVCYGTAPTLFGELSTLSGGGGPGSYSYKWESAADPGFTTPVNEGTGSTYQASNLIAPTYYRRTVYSGLSDCCQDISNTISIGINPLPVGDIAAGQDEEICSGESIEFSLTVNQGTAPYSVIIGDGFANQNISASAAGPQVYNITPTYSTDKTLNYSLISIEDQNGCFATAMTGSKQVLVYEMPDSDAGPDDEVCGFDYKLSGIASAGIGIWQWDGPSSVFASTNLPGSDVSFSDFAAGDTTCRFWWKEVNVLSRCVDSAYTDIHFWKEPTIADAGKDTILLPFQIDLEMYANQPLVGVGTWDVISGGGSVRATDINLNTGRAEGLSDGLNILEWRISNGICDDTFDEIEISVPEVNLINGFSPNNDGINDFFVINGLVEWDGDVVKNELVITDMTGVILYREKDYANDWDGRDMYGKPLPAGTYYYFINVFYSRKVQLKGFVIIKRD